jgi:hypothetical protein
MLDSKLKPLTKISVAQLFNEETASSNIKYLIGKPRSYHYNASKGSLLLNGEIPITMQMEAFSFVPIAYRLFRDSLFTKKGAISVEKDWVEFYVLNENLQICVITFHQYSVEMFLQHFADYLYYDDLTPCECVFTVTPMAKTTQKLGETFNYTIASFRSTKADKDTIEAIRILTETVRQIYRRDTFREEVRHTESQNFNLLETSGSRHMRLIEEEKESQALIAEFDQQGATSERKLKRAA